jgi:chromatin remodeling complex protein RSC6
VARCLSNYLSAVVIHIEGKTTASAAAAAAAAASSSSSAAVPSTPSAAATSAAAGFALPSAAPLLSSSPSATAAATASAAAAAAAGSTTKEKEVSYSETIEWRKHTSVSLADGFEIRRHGSQGFVGDVHVLVQLYMDFSPPRFRVSPALARLLGLPLAAAPPLPSLYSPAGGPANVNPAPFIAFETSATVLTAFWDYVKSRGLYDALAVAPGSSSTSGSGGVVRCDAAMQSLFGVETISGAHALSYLQLHMSPAGAEPICIPYRLSTSTVSQQSPMHAPSLEPTPSPSRVVSYDILTHSPLVPGASSLSEAYSDASAYSGGIKCASGAPPSIHAAAAALTDKLAGFMMELDRSHRRRVLLSSFSSAPLQSLQLLVASHARDLLVLPSVTGVDDELERRAEYFHAEWIYDAVDRYQQEEQASNQRDMQTAANVFAEEE